MADFRIPRGYGRVDWPFLTRFENGTTPSYKVYPASFLPVYALDERQDDPIVLPPGTFVGRLNDRDHTTVPDFYMTGDPIVPACPVSYVVTYGSNDLDTAITGGTPDIDSTTGAVVTSTGDGTNAVGIVKPCGITARPYYAGWIRDRYYNYDPYMIQTWLSGLHIVRIPCITEAEAAVEPGDMVMLNDASTPKWNPGDLLTSPVPGRVMAFNGGSFSADNEFIVGRCTNKVKIGTQVTPTAGQSLRTAIGTGAPQTLVNIDTTAALLWPDGENFEVQSKVEGVPGLQLSATSATLGRPAELLHARADAGGDFWAIDILIRV